MLYFDPKDSDDIDDFTIDFDNYLATGETISTATATLVAGAVTLGSTSISGTNVTTRISAGTAGLTAQVRIRITTSTSRQLDETMVFDIVAN